MSFYKKRRKGLISTKDCSDVEGYNQQTNFVARQIATCKLPPVMQSITLRLIFKISNIFSFILTIMIYHSEPGSEDRLNGRLILFSGKTGHVLQWKNVPDERETYFSPVVYSLSNGTDIVLFGTGGETHPGALWAIGLIDLYHGLIEKAIKIYSDNYKGMYRFIDYRHHSSVARIALSGGITT